MTPFWEGVVSLVKSAPVQAITSIIAVLSFYKTHLQRQRIQIIPADSLRVIVGPGEGITALHLACTLVNHGGRTGVLQRLEAEVTPPNEQAVRFVWYEFYKYVEGGQSYQKEADPHPVAISARESKTLDVEFLCSPGQRTENWGEGRYKVVLKGWINKRERGRGANLEASFHFLVSEMFALIFSGRQEKARAVSFPVSEWQRRNSP